MLLRFLGLIGLVFAAVFVTPPARADSAGVDSNALQRIKLATRQSTLAQRIAKATCYTVGGVRGADMSEAAWMAADEFETNAAALLDGSAPLGLAPETDRALVEALTVVNATWGSFGAAARQLVSGDLHSVAIAQIIYKNPAILSEIDDVVRATSAVYGAGMTARQDRLETVKIAARQVMLLEKMAMQYCYVALDIQAKDMRGGLTRNVARFDKALTALETGNFEMSVIYPPDQKFLVKVTDIRTYWQELRGRLVKVVEGQNPQLADLESLVSLTDSAVAASHELATLYITSD